VGSEQDWLQLLRDAALEAPSSAGWVLQHPPGQRSLAEPGRLRVLWERGGWMASATCAAQERMQPGKDFLLVK